MRRKVKTIVKMSAFIFAQNSQKHVQSTIEGIAGELDSLLAKY